MSGFGDGRGMEQCDADRRYARAVGRRALTALPFNHASGVTASSGGTPTWMDTTFLQIFELNDATDHVALDFDNFQVNTVGGETNGTKITVEATVWVRLATTSTFYGPTRVTFGGGNATSTVIHPRARVRSDPAFIGYVPQGTSIRVHVRVQIADGGNLPSGRLASWGSQGYQSGDQLENPAPTITGIAGYGPCAVWAYGDRWSGLALLGDSIIAGTGETSGLAGGWAARRCYALGIGTVFAPKSGESFADWLSAYSKRQNRLSLAATCPRVLLGYGINDFSAARTLAQVKADAIAAVRELGQLGAKTFLCTLVPKTSSTDAWATAANQTPSLATQAELDRQAFNTWLRDGTAAVDIGSTYAGFLDVAAQVEVDATNALTSNGGRWLATGGTGVAAYTADGLHPTTLGHTLIGACIDPDLGAQLVRGYDVDPRVY